MDVHGIPVVDFSAFSLDVEESDVEVCGDGVVTLSDQIYQALSTVGFVYITNHGIDTLKRWPGDDEVPNFKTDLLDFNKTCARLSLRILRVLGIGLKLEVYVNDVSIGNANQLADLHRYLKQDDITVTSSSSIRLLSYPAAEMETVQMRCGEHTDYGSMTLLFQDDAGGLEVQRTNGQFIPAKPIPNTIIVNIADMLQRWTSDRLKSTVHRVIVPEGRLRTRMSIAFFVDPDSETIVECLDGSRKYEPIRYLDHLNQRFKDTGMIVEES